MNDPIRPSIDVNVITQPLKDARDKLAAEVAEHKSNIAAIELAAQNEAAEVLRRGADKVAPVIHQVRTLEAHIARFNLLISEEERQAREAGAAPTGGQPPADPYRPPPAGRPAPTIQGQTVGSAESPAAPAAQDGGAER